MLCQLHHSSKRLVLEFLQPGLLAVKAYDLSCSSAAFGILSSCALGTLLDTFRCPMSFELEVSEEEVEFVEPPPPQCGFHAIVACASKSVFDDDHWTPYSAYKAEPVEPPSDAGGRTES